MDDKPRLLIVEDNVPLLKRLARIMSDPPPEWIVEVGPRRFDIDKAATAQDARQLFDAVLKAGRPYEAVLLDLNMPATPEEALQGKGDQVHGRDLLREIRSRSDTAVVILTAHDTTENLIHAVQWGATDFLIKPLSNRDAERNVFVRLVNAVGVTRLIARQKMREQRELRLIQHQKKADANQIAQTITDLVRNISDRVDGVAEPLLARYGFDVRKDTDDVVAEHLRAIGDIADEIAEKVWAGPDDQGQPIQFKEVDVGAVVDRQAAHAQPCFIHKNVMLTVEVPKGLKTRTVKADLQAMVEELVLGALDESPGDTEVKLSAERSEGGKDIIVSVFYRGKPFPADLQQMLQRGDVPRELRSLFFVRCVARDIGVRIRVESDEAQNEVRLLIPVINHE